MEKTDSQAKQAALDNKSAYAGNVAPDPEMDVDPMGTRAGLDIQPEEPLSVAEDMQARDRDRYELDVDSKASRSVEGSPDIDQLEIAQSETGQYEAVQTQPIQSGQPEDLA